MNEFLHISKMANVRDSDTSLWLHNKLGTSNDSWISGSICSQLNKEVLRNIKDCFSDLQTQVKLKLLLSFFHIPRRLVEEWKTELEEIIEVAGLDSELWVSMVAETMKTFAATGSLNIEISDYEETRPIFTDMVNDLRKLVSKHSDLGMLPLECQYLNKSALASVVGQQPNSIKHFTLKRKPKSANLRVELLQKSVDAQSSLKKTSAPAIPLRSRGMPRKMTDTTPLKGIPSRVPTSGFRSPTSGQSQVRPNLSRTPAGRKDGGIKLIEFTEQPLGYAAAKKRKRQQEQEEQQKKAMEAKQQATTTANTTNNNNNDSGAITTVAPVPTTTPDYAAGLAATSVYTQPSTPAMSTMKEEPLKISGPIVATTQIPNNIPYNSPAIKTNPTKMSVDESETQVKMETKNKKEDQITQIQQLGVDEISIKSPNIVVVTTATTPVSNSSNRTTSVDVEPPPLSTSTISTKMSTPIIINSQNQIILSPTTLQKPSSIATNHTIAPNNTIKTVPITSLPHSSGTPMIISQTIIQPTKTTAKTQLVQTTPSAATVSPISVVQGTSSNQQQPTQIILTSSSGNLSSLSGSLSSLTTIAQALPSQTVIQAQPQGSQTTKILLKTAPTIPVMVSSTRSNVTQTNPPPLIATQQPTILNIQNVNLPNRPVTIQPASQAAQAQHIQAQLQQRAHTVVSNTNQTQQPKFAQVVMSPGANVKGKTIILTQKGVILKNVGGDLYQQIPISNVSFPKLEGATIVATGPPNLIKSSTNPQGILQQSMQTTVKPSTQQVPALIPTNSLSQGINVSSLTPVVIASHNIQQQTQQPQTVQAIIGSPSQQTIIRPILSTNVQSTLSALPQGLTLIQRPGQQPQLIQVQNAPAQQTQQSTQIQRTTISQPTQTQIRPQIIIQHKPQTIVATHSVQQQGLQQQQQQQNPQQQPQRKGLSLSNEHVIKAHEMFRKANRVSRPDKALILGFMAGLRENPRPNPENVIVIKLGDSEEKVKQEDGSYALMLVESHIRLDYNTGEWKTFQSYQRSDQNTQQQGSDNKISQTKNSVVIQN